MTYGGAVAETAFHGGGSLAFHAAQRGAERGCGPDRSYLNLPECPFRPHSVLRAQTVDIESEEAVSADWCLDHGPAPRCRQRHESRGERTHDDACKS